MIWIIASIPLSLMGAFCVVFGTIAAGELLAGAKGNYSPEQLGWYMTVLWVLAAILLPLAAKVAS